MFIRKKKIRGKEYAYLVENRYNKKKKQSRQQSTSYLGKVIILSSADRQTVASTLKEAIINELTNVGFKFKDNQLVKDSIVIDLNTVEVKENNKKVESYSTEYKYMDKNSFLNKFYSKEYHD